MEQPYRSKFIRSCAVCRIEIWHTNSIRCSSFEPPKLYEEWREAGFIIYINFVLEFLLVFLVESCVLANKASNKPKEGPPRKNNGEKINKMNFVNKKNQPAAPEVVGCREKKKFACMSNNVWHSLIEPCRKPNEPTMFNFVW